MVVECMNGPLDGLTVETSLPLTGFLWIVEREGGLGSAYRKPAKNRHLYRASHVMVASRRGRAMRFDYAGNTHALCSSCGSVSRKSARGCALCGAAAKPKATAEELARDFPVVWDDA